MGREGIRIVLVDHTSKVGGAELSLLWLAKTVNCAEVRVIAVLGEDGDLAGRLRQEGIEVVIWDIDHNVGGRRKEAVDARIFRDPRLLVGGLRSVLRLRRIFRELDADIVHTNTLKAHVLGGLAGRLAGSKVIWHMRDHVSAPYLQPSSVLALRLMGRLVPHRVVAVSQSVAATLARKDAIVIHQGVAYDPTPRPPAPEGAVRIGMVGRLSPWKGQDIFLAAAEIVLRAHPQATFILAGSAIFGEEAYVELLQERVRRRGLEANVQFLGQCEDVWPVYAELDIAVHASILSEPYGNVILEAMAGGAAVIAAAAGGPLEIVDHGHTGLLVEPGDPEILAAAISSLIEDPDLRSRLATTARNRLLADYSLRADADAMIDVYRDVV